MRILKRIREMEWKKVREGARELDGARGFLRAARRNWYMWVAIVFGIWSGSFWLMAVFAVCAIISVTAMDWTLEGYKKIIEGYGTMVDQQQRIIVGYQGDKFMHLTRERARDARARLN